VIVLGIESATDLVGAALHHNGEILAVLSETGRRRHAEALAPAIASVLGSSGVSLRDLDAVAVDVGPGLFTGLRVGVATAKGLGQGLGLGLLGCTSLEVLAAASFEGGWVGTVLSVLDGRRGEVFTAHFARPDTDGELVELAPPARHRPEEIASIVRGGSGVLVVGDGALRYRELLEGSDGLVVADGSRAHPDPSTLASLAARRIGAGASLMSAASLEALYLRDADARINWVQREPAAARGA
jgi:tRNA threonylcarbamoyladenosine biosynthesis protein TsaB